MMTSCTLVVLRSVAHAPCASNASFTRAGSSRAAVLAGRTYRRGSSSIATLLSLSCGKSKRGGQLATTTTAALGFGQKREVEGKDSGTANKKKQSRPVDGYGNSRTASGVSRVYGTTS